MLRPVLILAVLYFTNVFGATLRNDLLKPAQLIQSEFEVLNNSTEDFLNDSSDEDESDSESFEEDSDDLKPESGGAWFLDDKGQLQYADFSAENPSMVSAKSDKKNIKFYLYTQGNEKEQLFVDDLESIRASSFNYKDPVKILIHGFTNSHKSEFVQEVKDAYLDHYKYNVIAVDWGRLCGAPWYYSASKNTMRVGQYTAKLVGILVNEFKSKLSKIHIIGHSLGAHTSAITNKHLPIPGKVSRITGLDPALPLYGSAAKKWLLTTDDAEFVDVIHTSGGNLGFMDPLGHGDFYPNGGKASQPGCGWDLTSSCSHSRSWEYFAETIRNEVAFPTKACDDVKQAEKGKCNADRDFTPNMGEKAYKDEELETGIYYTKTKKGKPYAINSKRYYLF